MADQEVDAAAAEAMRLARARNRVSVSAEVFGRYNDPSRFVPPVHPKTPEQMEKIRLTILKCFLFSSVGAKDLAALVGAFEAFEAKQGDTLIRQGDAGDKLYLIEEGTADFSKVNPVDGQVVHLCTMKDGECFGELALMYNSPRACTVVAKTDMKLWTLDRSTFNHIVRTAIITKREKYDKLLKDVALLSKLDPYDRCRLADSLTEKTFQDEDIIVEGQEGACMFMLLEGKAEAYCQGKLVKSYREGGYFGEIALLAHTPRASTVKAVGKCVVVVLERESCVNLLGPMEECLKNNLKEYQKVLSALHIDKKLGAV
ncbi:cAMP-dependent protein kinase regulatory subunit [Babesia gibsoni]|uniref:cAMP-dependent protein kinase regulatory subunit n=1 Tax=Babesia gibsoni TaxID=33632 RepID=A0AAD8LS39_BABGI|nr:cAMP-dependent protein kinase regulatory subunit [Babesia gibsoni]